jgi:hypothetical protein
MGLSVILPEGVWGETLGTEIELQSTITRIADKRLITWAHKNTLKMLNVKFVHYTRMLLLASTEDWDWQGHICHQEGWQVPRGPEPKLHHELGFPVLPTGPDGKATIHPASWASVLQTWLPTEQAGSSEVSLPGSPTQPLMEIADRKN